MSDSDSSFLPPEVVEAFTTAAITALQELTQTEAYAQLSPEATEGAENFVQATLQLKRSVPGKLTLILTEDAASRLAARYLPGGTLLTKEMIDDVIGEFANVIAGQSKTMLKGTPYHFTLSTPVVARVESFARLPEDAGTLIAALGFDAGQLLVILDLSPCPGA